MWSSSATRILALMAVGTVACTTTGPRDGSAAAARTATVLFFADAHGAFESHAERFWRDGDEELVEAGGYSRLAAEVKRVRAETGGRALLVDGGDTFQGSGPLAWSRGEVALAPQRALGVDAAVPGNWEVVHGATRMRQLAAASGYPWLATNVVDERSGAPVFPGTLLRAVGGIRIGLVGFTDPEVPTRQSPSYSRGLRYLGEETLQPAVDELRAGGADVVIVVAHVGLARATALAGALRGVDAILASDSHERVYEPLVVNGVLVVEPGAFASFLGRLDITLSPSGSPRLAWRLSELRATTVPEDPEMRAVVDRALAPWRERMTRRLGAAAVPLERYDVVETTADDVLTAALLEATGTEIALSNGFRFGHPVAAGPVTEADLWRLYPVATRVKVGTVTGAQLRAFWEQELENVFSADPRRQSGGWLPRVAGMSVRFRAGAPAGSRIIAISVGGRPLDDRRRYTIAACEREGDAADTLCRIKRAADVRTLDLQVHDAVRAYLERHGEVGGPRPRRIVAADLPATVRSQVERR